MSYDFRLQIPEDSAEGIAIASLIAQEHISPEEAAKLLLAQAVRKLPTKPGKKKSGDVWGQFADDADVIDQIVSEAMQERRKQLDRSLNA